jgi:hypothetical protein
VDIGLDLVLSIPVEAIERSAMSELTLEGAFQAGQRRQ